MNLVSRTFHRSTRGKTAAIIAHHTSFGTVHTVWLFHGTIPADLHSMSPKKLCNSLKQVCFSGLYSLTANSELSTGYTIEKHFVWSSDLFLAIASPESSNAITYKMGSLAPPENVSGRLVRDRAREYKAFTGNMTEEMLQLRNTILCAGEWRTSKTRLSQGPQRSQLPAITKDRRPQWHIEQTCQNCTELQRTIYRL